MASGVLNLSRVIAGWSLLSFAALGAFRDVGEDLRHAPPPFTFSDRLAVPIDFQFYNLSLTFDVASQRAVGKATIEFYAATGGHPILDLVPNPSSVRLNGQELGSAGLMLVSPPQSNTQLRVLNQSVSEYSFNLLEIEYELTNDNVAFSGSGASALFNMSDVTLERAFLESYAPANLEFDQVGFEFDVTITGAHSQEALFTNGEVQSLGTNRWHIRYPPYFTSSSLFFHLTEKPLVVRRSLFSGVKNVPLTVYAATETLAESGMASLRTVLPELENTYGPLAHPSFTAYITGPGGSGMEYAGATMTGLEALGHEVTHSWFARGVMPANGNSGWIDEAIARWRDKGYPTYAVTPSTQENLAAFSPYFRRTPYAAYQQGSSLLGHLNYFFRNVGGLKPALKQFFAEYQNQTTNTPEFETLLNQFYAFNISDLFRDYVYKPGPGRLGATFSLLNWNLDSPDWGHPRPYTKEEIRALR